jgi:hypothetical protein
MSTSIENQDLINTIQQLQQRIESLERQQRTIATDTGVNINGDTIGTCFGVEDISLLGLINNSWPNLLD